MKGHWSGLELKCHHFGEFGPSLQRWKQSPDCCVLSSAGKEVSHEQIGLSVLVVGRGRGEEKEEREHMDAPVLPKPRSIFSWGAQSVRCPGEWREVRCLLCQRKMNRQLPAHGGTNCCDLAGLHFPSFRRLHMSRCANTDADTINKMNRYMLQF